MTDKDEALAELERRIRRHIGSVRMSHALPTGMQMPTAIQANLTARLSGLEYALLLIARMREEEGQADDRRR